MKSSTHALCLPEREAEWKASGNDWYPFAIRTCYPRSLYRLMAHASILSPSSTPHDPHAHAEEELIVILSGSVRIIRTDRGSEPQSSALLTRGAFTYHPAGRPHTIQSCGETPAVYICLKWVAPITDREGFLDPTDYVPAYGSDADQGWTSQVVIDSPTQMLSKLQCHTSVMKPNAGYDPHADEYDVIIITLDGELETLGQRVSADSLVYYQGCEPHGMRNVGSDAARYLVFEFHRRSWLLRWLPDSAKERLAKRILNRQENT